MRASDCLARTGRTGKLHILLLTVPLMISSAPAAAAQGEDTEYAVYAAVLERFTGPGISRVVLIDSTRGWALPEYYLRELQRSAPEATAALLSDYGQRNAHPVALTNAIPLPVEVQLISFADLDSLIVASTPEPADSQFDWLRRHFSGSAGVVSLSRPGFSEDGSRAFIRVSRQCGSRCGELAHVVLRREGDRWQVEHWIVRMLS